MDEYIERKALMEYADTQPGGLISNKSIQFFPAADVAPVRHGYWIGLEYDGYADGNPVYDLWECSECGEEVRGEDVPDTHPYCHGCGAKMDLEYTNDQ